MCGCTIGIIELPDARGAVRLHIEEPWATPKNNNCNNAMEYVTPSCHNRLDPMKHQKRTKDHLPLLYRVLCLKCADLPTIHAHA